MVNCTKGRVLATKVPQRDRMNKEQIKSIFSRFQNLNLLTLIEDLKWDAVARDAWNDLERNILCPLAHGWCRNITPAEAEKNKEHELVGITENNSDAFVVWWDGHSYHDEEYDELSYTKRILQDILREVWEERKEDAKAVQFMLEPVTKVLV